MSKAPWFAALCSISLLAGCGEVAPEEYSSSSSKTNNPGASSSSFSGGESSSSGFDINLEWVNLGGYSISKNLITQGQYEYVMGVNPSKGAQNVSWPVDGVNWFQAAEFCKKLSVLLPTEEEWMDAASQDSIQRNYDYWEWTDSCDGNYCIRKGLVNRIDDFYFTDPNLSDISGGYISFRVVKEN